MNEFEKQQVTLLATYYPYSWFDIEYVYLKCDKSFDKTCKALELACAHNSIEYGFQQANNENQTK